MQVRKNPHGSIQGPVQLKIAKETCPTMKWAGKHWMADVGDITRCAYNDDRVLGNSVLAEAYDKNITRYGKKSYTPKVDKFFRPPIRDPMADLPISRMPVRCVKGRMNPENPVEEQNIRSDVVRFIHDKNLILDVRPSYVVPVSAECVGELKDLRRNNAAVSATSGESVPYTFTDPSNIRDAQRNNEFVYADAGVTSLYQEKQEMHLRDLERNTPMTSVGSGVATMLEYTDPSQFDRELERKNEMVNVNAGMNPMYGVPIEYGTVESQRNNEIVQAESGVSTLGGDEVSPIEYDLSRNTEIIPLSLNPEVQYKHKEDTPLSEKVISHQYINVPIVATSDYNLRMHTHNEAPKMRPTVRSYNPGDYGAGAVMPRAIYNMTPRQRCR